MSVSDSLTLEWALLTMCDRALEIESAIDSIIAADPSRLDPITVVGNGCADGPSPGDRVTFLALPDNLGVPGGRDVAMRRSSADVVVFLDDDAMVATAGFAAQVVAYFEADPYRSAVGFRIVDEAGESSQRHIPRPGSRSAAVPGDVVSFPGGATAIRRSHYLRSGGYWSALFYGHEETDLTWRLHDRGGTVWYAADLVVRHPRTSISRHADGWRLTGRNRVLIARRNLPWPVLAAHVSIWLLVGAFRAPDRACRRQYVRGWMTGWRLPVERRPVRWSTVLTLARRGRPPMI